MRSECNVTNEFICHILRLILPVLSHGTAERQTASTHSWHRPSQRLFPANEKTHTEIHLLGYLPLSLVANCANTDPSVIYVGTVHKSSVLLIVTLNNVPA